MGCSNSFKTCATPAVSRMSKGLGHDKALELSLEATNSTTDLTAEKCTCCGRACVPTAPHRAKTNILPNENENILTIKDTGAKLLPGSNRTLSICADDNLNLTFLSKLPTCEENSARFGENYEQLQSDLCSRSTDVLSRYAPTSTLQSLTCTATTASKTYTPESTVSTAKLNSSNCTLNPKTITPRPITSSLKPSTSNPRPSTSKPTTTTPRPITSSLKPSTSKPTTTTPKTITSTPKPSTSSFRTMHNTPLVRNSSHTPKGLFPSFGKVDNPPESKVARISSLDKENRFVNTFLRDIVEQRENLQTGSQRKKQSDNCINSQAISKISHESDDIKQALLFPNNCAVTSTANKTDLTSSKELLRSASMVQCSLINSSSNLSLDERKTGEASRKGKGRDFFLQNRRRSRSRQCKPRQKVEDFCIRATGNAEGLPMTGMQLDRSDISFHSLSLQNSFVSIIESELECQDTPISSSEDEDAVLPRRLLIHHLTHFREMISDSVGDVASFQINNLIPRYGPNEFVTNFLVSISRGSWFDLL